MHDASQNGSISGVLYALPWSEARWLTLSAGILHGMPTCDSSSPEICSCPLCVQRLRWLGGYHGERLGMSERVKKWLRASNRQWQRLAVVRPPHYVEFNLHSSTSTEGSAGSPIIVPRWTVQLRWFQSAQDHLASHRGLLVHRRQRPTTVAGGTSRLPSFSVCARLSGWQL